MATPPLLSLGAVIFLLPILPAESANRAVTGFELKGNIAVVTDYISRGYSQTGHDPALQGGLQLQHETGFFLGVWGSNVDFDDGGDTFMELNFSGGLARAWDAGLDLEISIIQHIYPNAPGRFEYDYQVIHFGAGYTLLDARLEAHYYHSEDFFGVGDEPAVYAEINASYVLPNDITLHAHIGHTYGDAIETLDPTNQDLHSYDDYRLGVATEVAGFDMDLSFHNVSSDARTLFPTTYADDRFVFGLSKAF